MQTESVIETESVSCCNEIEVKKSDEIKSICKLFPLVINTIIGTGIFGLPFAYYEAGFYSSVVTLFIILLINILTSNYVLETLARIPAILKRVEYKLLLNSEEDPSIDSYSSEIIIQKPYSYIEMGNALGGNPLKYLSTICLTLNCYCGLWAYVATVLTTLTTVVWIIVGDQEKCTASNHFMDPWECNLVYYLSILIYGLIVIPICFIDLGDQTFIQTFLTIIRFTAFILMIITCIVQLSISGPLVSERSIFDFYPNGFGTMFTHTVFAFILQPTIPNIIEPAVGKRKFVHIPIIIGLILSALFYALIGSVCSYTFNGEVQTPVTLNWANYTGREGGWGKGTELWFGYIIKYFILIVPVFNLTSTIPIVSHTIALNVHGLFKKQWVEKNQSKSKYISRAIAIFPPFILSCFIDSLEVIFDFCGLIAFFLVFTIPCVFVFMSLKKFKPFHWLGVNPKTPFTMSFFSSSSMITTIFIITFIAFIAACYFLIKDTILSFTNDESISL